MTTTTISLDVSTKEKLDVVRLHEYVGSNVSYGRLVEAAVEGWSEENDVDLDDWLAELED